MKDILHGIIPPLVTPLDSDGNVDKDGIEKLVEYQVEAGIQSIFILGSCGEGSALGREVCRDMAKETVKAAMGRINLLAGILESSSGRAVETIHEYEELGITRFVVPPPFYLAAADQGEILRHYEYIAERVDGELIVYNIPDFVHSHIMPETAKTLLEHPKITGMKDSTGDWALFQRILLESENGKSILSGNENLCGAAMLCGADGCVPCLANAYPELFQKMYRCAEEKNIEAVLACQRIILRLKDIMGIGKYWIAGVKYMCARKGLIQPFVKGSAYSLTSDETRKMDVLLTEAGL